MFYAHSKMNTPEDSWHSLYSHLSRTSELAAGFAEKFKSGVIAKIAGLLHDAGKYSLEFQKRLKGAKTPVNHSTAGAQEAFKRYGKGGLVLAYIIAGHHAGLPDWVKAGSDTSLKFRLEQTDLPDYKAFYGEIKNLPEKLPGFPIKCLTKEDVCFAFFFFTRMLYSCLVDADFLDTEKFLNPGISEKRGIKSDFDKLIGMFDDYMSSKLSEEPDKPINKKRKIIYDSCINKSTGQKGLFTLQVPTGGGKTLSSMAFALRHAREHSMERIIYVIPYTSIIEQNAEVYRGIFGDKYILEHHSSFQFEKTAEINVKENEDVDCEENPMRLAAENWDIPIIATTNVQFFESLFSNRSSKCRKLHNICNSVIVLDEAQMLPFEFLKPCLAALCELIVNYGCSIVLCTATQPDFARLLPKGIKAVPLVDDALSLFESLKRVNISYIGHQSDEELAEKLADHSQVLCIVNTRPHAAALYDLISEYEGSFHLSTYMCPKHRSDTLALIKERLERRKTEPGLPCRVVSTQLVEAGVDLDFPFVYRAIAGIDSINQAAGRCNREGGPVLGSVFVFEPDKPAAVDSFLARAASIGREVIREYKDPALPDAIQEYFRKLYHLDDKLLDKYDILNSVSECGHNLQFPFATVADKFELINKNQIPVVIPYNEDCRKMLAAAEWLDKPMTILRKLQPYVVQLEYYQFAEFQKNGLLDIVADTFYVLNDMGYYDGKKGLKLPKGAAPMDVLIG